MNRFILTAVACLVLTQLVESKPKSAKTTRSLVEVIKQIDATKFFSILTPEEQSAIIQLVIHGESHTIGQYIDKVGYASVLQIIEKLPEVYAKEITGYIINALTIEARPTNTGTVGQGSSSA